MTSVKSAEKCPKVNILNELGNTYKSLVLMGHRKSLYVGQAIIDSPETVTVITSITTLTKHDENRYVRLSLKIGQIGTKFTKIRSERVPD